jgi:hypothetical protein
MTGCTVEEEIPPQMEDYCNNSTNANDKGPRINWGDCRNKEDTHQHTFIEDHGHSAPSSCRLMEDHLVLIFNMRNDLAEKLHNQHILSKHLDVLFESLSSKHAKSRCPTYCHPYAFKIHEDGCSGSPHV